MHYPTMVANAANWHRMIQFELDTEYYIKANVDEMSIVFSLPHALEGFVQWAKEIGYEHFNTVVKDDVTLVDHSPAFDNLEPNEANNGFQVRFEFLRITGAPWRIEAMCILGGHAPLHANALDEFGEGACIHASFKERDSDTFKARKRSMANPGNGFKALEFLAEYRNSYGRFAYFGKAGLPPYIKPRINLRD